MIMIGRKSGNCIFFFLDPENSMVKKANGQDQERCWKGTIYVQEENNSFYV